LILLEKEKSLIGIYLTAHPLDDYKLEIESFCSRDVFLKDINNDIEKYIGRDFAFGGMVTANREATSKNGNPFSTFTLSDYTDSLEFFLFGQDYVNFQKYCKTGLFLLVRGTVKPRYNGSSYEFKISQIELLSEVRKNYVKSITLNLPVHILNEEVVERLETMTVNNKGKTLLKFNIYNLDNNMNVQMFSRTAKINLTDEFLKFFDEDLNITYRIN
jgi:DNA polymerase-3 subunit alpha